MNEVYASVIAKLRNRQFACEGTGNPNIAKEFETAADSFEKLLRDNEDIAQRLRRCRNELCLHCGQYKLAHKGACDGCIWANCAEV